MPTVTEVVVAMPVVEPVIVLLLVVLELVVVHHGLALQLQARPIHFPI